MSMMKVLVSADIGCELMARCGDHYKASLGRKILQAMMRKPEVPPFPKLMTTHNGMSVSFDVQSDVEMHDALKSKAAVHNAMNPHDRLTKTALARRLLVMGLIEAFPEDD